MPASSLVGSLDTSVDQSDARNARSRIAFGVSGRSRLRI